MAFMIAVKSFFKALKDPKKAEEFLDGKEKEVPSRGDASHLRLLAMLQQSGRLIDFLKEDVKGFTDAEIGAAARQIHEECQKSLEDHVTIRPIMDQNEGETIRVPVGYDASSIKLVGNVKGQGPYSGVLVHKGWKAHKRSLPKQLSDHSLEIIQPAEVEIR